VREPLFAEATNLFKNRLRVGEVLAALHQARAHAQSLENSALLGPFGDVRPAHEKVSVRVPVPRMRVARPGHVRHQRDLVQGAFEVELQRLTTQQRTQRALPLPACRLVVPLGRKPLELDGPLSVERLLDSLAGRVDGRVAVVRVFLAGELSAGVLHAQHGNHEVPRGQAHSALNLPKGDVDQGGESRDVR
jgi:hypothetical protein